MYIGILLFQILFQCLYLRKFGKFFFALISDNVLRVEFNKFAVYTFHRNAGIQRSDSRYISIMVLLQIHHQVTGGKHNIDTPQHIADGFVLRFQLPALLPGSHYQECNINRKENQKADLQQHARPVSSVYHCLRDVFGKCLYQHIGIIRQVHDTKVVRLTALVT